jgi:hypothetical protein
MQGVILNNGCFADVGKGVIYPNYNALDFKQEDFVEKE